MDIETLSLQDAETEAVEYLRKLNRSLLTNTYVYSGFLQQEGNVLWTLEHVVNDLLSGNRMSTDVVQLKRVVSDALTPQTSAPTTQLQHDITIQTLEFRNRFDELCSILSEHNDCSVRFVLSNNLVLVAKSVVYVDTYSGVTLSLGTSASCLKIGVEIERDHVTLDLTSLLVNVDRDTCFSGQSVGLDFAFQLLYDVAWTTGCTKCSINLLDGSYFPNFPSIDRKLPYLLAYGETFYSRNAGMEPRLAWGPRVRTSTNRHEYATRHQPTTTFQKFQKVLEVGRTSHVDESVWTGLDQFQQLLGPNTPTTYQQVGSLVVNLSCRPYFLGDVKDLVESSIKTLLDSIVDAQLVSGEFPNFTVPNPQEASVEELVKAVECVPKYIGRITLLCKAHHFQTVDVPKLRPLLFQRHYL